VGQVRRKGSGRADLVKVNGKKDPERDVKGKRRKALRPSGYCVEWQKRRTS